MNGTVTRYVKFHILFVLCHSLVHGTLSVILDTDCFAQRNQ